MDTNNNTATLNTSPSFDVSEPSYTFRPYDSQLAIPVGDGQRLVKCLYKVAKTGANAGKAAGINSYITVPENHLDESVMVENAAMLAPYMSAYFQGVEDGIIKEHHKNGGKGFGDTFLSLAKILEHLDDAGQGNRLNKEKIEAWFNSDMREPLLVAFADKMGVGEVPTEAELAKLEQVTAVYRAKFASLASGKTAYRKEEAELMQKALEVTEVLDTNLGARFYGRLEKMKSATSNDLLMSL